MKKYFLFIFITIILQSCKDNSDGIIRIEEFASMSLVADSLNLSGQIIVPRKIFRLGECLALFEDSDNDGCIHFYTLDGKYLKKTCKIGNSKEEFISPNVFKNGKDILIISLKGNYERITYDSGEIIEHTMQLVENEDVRVGNNFIAALNDGGYILDNPTCSEMFAVISSTGERHDYSFYPSDFSESIDAFYKKNVLSVFAASMTYSLDSLFLSFTYYPCVKVITAEGRQCSSIKLYSKYSNEYVLKNNIPHFISPILFYTCATSTEKYYYALYQNGTKEELKNNIGKSEIHKFNKEGVLLDRFILDRRIYNFDVSSNDSVIYALGINRDLNTEVYCYKMRIW